jgi:hypothetical protein
VPNVRLPHEPDCVNLRCAQKRDVAAPPPAQEKKGAFLTRNESHAMACCFGKNLKFVIGHSTKSGILACFSKKSKELKIPQTIEDEVSRLFAIDITSENSDDEIIAKSRTRQTHSDTVCVPLSMHLKTDDKYGSQ